MSTETLTLPDDDLAELKTSLVRLGKDLKQASKTLGRREARWLVDTYYVIQDARIRSGHQKLTQEKTGEPHRLQEWVNYNQERLEEAVKASLGVFAAEYRVGKWMQGVYGIGPVLSSAMLCYFDIRKARTVGHFWRFAGLDPTCKWEKKQKRPYCAKLKSICAYRMGECFVRLSNKDKCFYGKLYRAKKDELIAKNEAGEFKATADAELETKGARMAHTERYKHWKEGKLAPAHIHERARRWMVKLFLSHLHHAMYQDYYGENPPAPYIFEHPELGDHRHLILPEDWSMSIPGKPLKDLLGTEV